MTFTMAEPDDFDATHVANVVDLVTVIPTEFESFYTSTRPKIVRSLALTLGNHELATDAADEGFTRAFQRWSTVSKLSNPSGWVYRVALNWALSIVRRAQRSPKIYATLSGNELAVPDPAIHQAIGSLDVKHRAIVVCHYFYDWTDAQIAIALGIRVGTVKSRLNRANAQLRTSLDHLRK